MIPNMNAERIALLVLMPLGAAYLAQIEAAGYEVLHAPGPAERAARIASPDARRIRAVLTIGTVGLTAAEIDALPALEVVCALGVGHERIDATAARSRGIAVAHGAGTNDDCVADHAFALLLAAVRGLVATDRACRAGVWRDALPELPQLAGKAVGILGLGRVGRKIARRAAGFDVSIGYHGRRRQDDVPWRWFDSPQALAAWCDALVVATPGGDATRHLVDASVLDALGPGGVLVNIARGSVVDTAALAAALRAGRLAAAGLDVYESEPLPPAELIGLDNVVLTPHVAGRSPQAVQASIDKAIANLDGHFSGRGVASPITA